MNVSELTLKLIILLIPGIISSNIYGKLTFRPKQKSNFMFTLASIIFGIVSYLSVQLLFIAITFLKNLNSCHYLNYDILDTFKNLSGTASIPYLEVLIASIFGIFIGFIASGIDNAKIINNLGRFLKFTNKYGDENLFMKFLGSKEVKSVYIRDIANKLTFSGYIESYSETEKFKEIVLDSVSVYD